MSLVICSSSAVTENHFLKDLDFIDLTHLIPIPHYYQGQKPNQH